jgi:hypothetical protein
MGKGWFLNSIGHFWARKGVKTKHKPVTLFGKNAKDTKLLVNILSELYSRETPNRFQEKTAKMIPLLRYGKDFEKLPEWKQMNVLKEAAMWTAAFELRASFNANPQRRGADLKCR